MIDFSDAYARALRNEAPIEPSNATQPRIVGIQLHSTWDHDETAVLLGGVQSDSEVVVSPDLGRVRVFFADSDGAMRELRVHSSEFLPRDTFAVCDPKEIERWREPREYTITGTWEPGPGWDDFVRSVFRDDQ